MVVAGAGMETDQKRAQGYLSGMMNMLFYVLTGMWDTRVYLSAKIHQIIHLTLCSLVSKKKIREGEREEGGREEERKKKGGKEEGRQAGKQAGRQE